MLPSTSSPVESAQTPVSLADGLSCSPDCLGRRKLPHGSGAAKEDLPNSIKKNIGMCVDGGSREKEATMPPPDLCTGEERNCDLVHGPSDSSCDEDAEATIAQAACDTKFVTSLSQVQMEGDVMEEDGAWGLPSYPPDSPSDATEDLLAEGSSKSTSASLPDLCDTRRGMQVRGQDSASSGSDSQRDSEYESSGSLGSEKVSGEKRVCEAAGCDKEESGAVNSSSSTNQLLNRVDDMDERLSCTNYKDSDISLSHEQGKLCVDESGEKISSEEGHQMDSMHDTNVETQSESVVLGETEGAAGPSEDFLVHDNQHISLVACGITQCDPSFQQDVEMADISEEEHGLDLIRHNLHHSSHPMFNKWPCYFYITQEHLPSFSIDSHGRHIGSEAAPMFFPSPSVSRPASQLTEEEQVKIAKRMGLITHLPCGIFDGSKKSGECVICMIDFTVGDRVRYLPCMHTYHTECIDDWLMRSFTCPSCLEPVDAALLNTYGTS
ncbi:uncharacterized protein LOC134765451 [Penaeus indicus]|uniref:uncharacterized protein LOC134765451 n=1 Tax=Penaeus indicus TaxID=29960 RepID=UPI00300D6AB4